MLTQRRLILTAVHQHTPSFLCRTLSMCCQGLSSHPSYQAAVAVATEHTPLHLLLLSVAWEWRRARECVFSHFPASFSQSESRDRWGAPIGSLATTAFYYVLSHGYHGACIHLVIHPLLCLFSCYFTSFISFMAHLVARPLSLSFVSFLVVSSSSFIYPSFLSGGR